MWHMKDKPYLRVQLVLVQDGGPLKVLFVVLV